MTEAKIHPPSRSRIAAARAAGFGPRPLLVGLSAGLFALASALRAQGATLAQDFATLLRAPLDAFAQGDAPLALTLAAAGSARLLRAGALIALAILVAVACALSLAQGLSFSSSRTAPRGFSAPRLSLEASVLAVVGVLALCSFHMVDALWLTPQDVLSFVQRVLNQLALLFVALAVIDASFARAQFFRALFLTRRELREEQREAYGAPELRAARATARAHSAKEPS